MKILVINSGSSSVKYELINIENESIVDNGIIERIGESKNVPDHKTAIDAILKKFPQIDAVGHRVVHGGEQFSASILIDAKVIKAIRDYFELAPLHNPPNLLGIEACKAALPKLPQVAVFDTAFFHSMLPYSYLYGLPYAYYEKYRIRKYGFHGTSHRYLSLRTAEILGLPLEKLKLITLHLGNGCSAAAVKFGKAIDCSMGFTPLGGLLMGTRCGDIDPAVVFYLMKKENLNPEEISNLLNKKSGLLGLSGISNDMRDIIAAKEKGNKRAEIAFKGFVHRIRKYIGNYSVNLDGVDAIVFSAGIGENAPAVRAAVCENMTFLGLKIDDRRNASTEKEKIISSNDSKVKVLALPTNEELMIARDTFEIVKQ